MQIVVSSFAAVLLQLPVTLKRQRGGAEHIQVKDFLSVFTFARCVSEGESLMDKVNRSIRRLSKSLDCVDPNPPPPCFICLFRAPKPVGGRTDIKQTNSGTTTQVCTDSKAVV